MRDVKNRRYRFDHVEIDVQNVRVTVGSEIRPLEPKSFRLLLVLVENPGRVLPKEEIMAVVWPDSRARRHASAALSLGGQPTVTLASDGFPVQSTLALALAGDSVLATNVADRLAGGTPSGSVAGEVWIPEIRAAIELQRGNPARAVELLAPATSYEAGWSDRFLSAYLRGEARFAEGRGQEAAAEFQKIINHRGAVLNTPIGALAHLGIARSYVLARDGARAAAAYRDFLMLWKDADPDIPILIAAKSEYDRLR